MGGISWLEWPLEHPFRYLKIKPDGKCDDVRQYSCMIEKPVLFLTLYVHLRDARGSCSLAERVR